MPNYKITIKYDGTDFYGWQSQPKGNTIQDEITSAIQRITQEKINNWSRILDIAQQNKSRLGLKVFKFVNLVEVNFKNEKDLSFYGSQLYISTDYLRKICYRYLQMSPKDCIKIRLTCESCKLLENPNLSITEISDMLGFDPNYFTRFFKSQIGCSPRDFRKSIYLT